MMAVLVALVDTLCGWARSRAALHLELLALRHQIQVLERSRPHRLRLTRADRWFWVGLARLWRQWRAALVIVKPDTVIAWQRQAFRQFWTWKSRPRVGRPTVPLDVRQLIRSMSVANPLWGAPRLHGELLKLGIAVSQASVAKYMARRRPPPSQTWRTFLRNHVRQLVAADFVVAPTVTGRLLFVLILLAHDRRRIVHVGRVEFSDTAGFCRHRHLAWTVPRSLGRVLGHYGVLCQHHPLVFPLSRDSCASHLRRRE